MRTVVFFAMLAVTLLPATAGAAPNAADKAAAQRISRHLHESGQLRNYRIGVVFHKGVASLTGTVADEGQRDMAIRLAKQVKGVKKVHCRLQSTGESAPGADSNAYQENQSEFQEAPGPAFNEYDRSGVTHAYGENQQRMSYSNERTAMPAPSHMSRQPRQMPRSNMPLPSRGYIDPRIQQASALGVHPAGGPCAENYGAPCAPMPGMGGPGGAQIAPVGYVPHAHGRGPSHDNAQMPGYAWPSYASYPNYAVLSYPKQYSPTAWPYIGPFYPYPQVPLAWRKVSLEWDDGWWFLDFSAHNSSH